MRRLFNKKPVVLLIMGFASIMIFVAPYQSSAITITEIIMNVNNAKQSAADYKCRVEGEVQNGGQESSRPLQAAPATSVVTFKKENKYHIRSFDPKGKLIMTIVFDGRTLWRHHIGNRAVIRTDFGEGNSDFGKQNIFLSNVFENQEKFNIAIAGTKVIDGLTTHVIEVTLKDSSAKSKIKKMRAWIDNQKWLVRRIELTIEIRDGRSNTVTQRFKDIQLNVDVDDSIFDFKVPAGVRVIMSEVEGKNGLVK